MNTTPELNAELIAKGLTAPRVTLESIEANIVSEYYFTAADGHRGSSPELSNAACEQALQLLTFCVLVLKNGFTVTGESACASPENFNAETGKKIARSKARDKIGDYMAYELRSQLSSMGKKL